MTFTMETGHVSRSKSSIGKLAVAVLLALTAIPANADLIPGLIEKLHHGGFVLVMRHASSPQNPPDRSTADVQNLGLERQLDQTGRQTAEAMGRAFRALRIPVGSVLSSPTYRALETVRLAGFGTPTTVIQLGDQGRSMGRLNGPGPAAWLQAAVTRRTPKGLNTIIITHMPNIVAAFPDNANGLKDGETLIFAPDGSPHARLAGTVLIEDWPAAVPKK
jgi:phosphohistidine phosphatase SixA